MARNTIKSDEMLQLLCDWFLTSITKCKKQARVVKDVRTCYCKEKYYVLSSSRYWLNGYDRVKVNERNEISIRVGYYEYVSTKYDNSRKRNILLLLVAKLEELFKD